jgi:hypothetical protein
MQVEHLDSEHKLDLAVPDWNLIELAYKTGALSVREIARRHGVSDTAIHKRAKAEGWKGLQEPELAVDPPVSPEPQTSAQTEPQTEVTNKSDDEGDESSGEFEWDPDNPDIIIPSVPSIAIYLNRWNHIVIRQEGGCRRCGDGDKFVFVDQQHLCTLIYRLELLLKQCQRSTG